MQLKAKRGSRGNTVSNSAYQPKMEAITANEAPDYAFMGFDPMQWLFKNLFLVPGHFLTPSVVEKRAPLSSDAQRSGWVGSNILLSRIPDAGGIDLVDGGDVIPPADDRDQFEQTAFLSQTDSTARDWTTAVMVSTTWISSRVIGLTALRDIVH